MVNMRKTLIVFLGFSFVIAHQGCVIDESKIPDGSLVGFVDLVDLHGKELLQRDGVEVRLEGSNRSIATAINGRFELKNIPAGTHFLEIEKEGFGKLKVGPLFIVGGQMPAFIEQELKLYQLPHITMPSASISLLNNDLVTNAKFTTQKPFAIKMLISDNPDFLSAISLFIETQPNCCKTETEIETESSTQLSHHLFPAGTKVYVNIFVHNPAEVRNQTLIQNKFDYSSAIQIEPTQHFDMP